MRENNYKQKCSFCNHPQDSHHCGDGACLVNDPTSCICQSFKTEDAPKAAETSVLLDTLDTSDLVTKSSV